MTAERETKMHTCKRGHSTEVHREPAGHWSACRVCVCANKKAWREANSEKAATYSKNYQEAVKQLAPDDEIKLNRKAYAKAYAKAYREVNRDRMRAGYKDYYEANRDKKRAYCKAYHEANKQRLNAARKERDKRAKEKRENGNQEKT